MTKPILYGTKSSPPVRAVLLTCKAIKLDIDFQEVDLSKGQNKTDEFVKMNPQQTIPLLNDDGKLIWDSHAIITYLVEKYGGNDNLYPIDLYQRALIDQKLHFDSGILYPRFASITNQIRVRNNPNITREQIEGLYEAYDLLDRFLQSKNYLNGDNVTIADFSCIATVSSMQGFAPLDSTKYPNVARWMIKMEELPYYEEENAKGANALIQYFNDQILQLKRSEAV